nr:immunoglobulin light chain junction region [Macaca mulatta]MOV72781.1 immunoglobulin light chain junction region [Macaca mulatta]MOV74204.1 immunoglobulin light chain junction region [Macaca mulatta]
DYYCYSTDSSGNALF